MLVLTIVCVVGGIALLLSRVHGKQPIVDLRAFTDRNFAAGSAFSFVMGIGLYGLTYLYPLYLARVRGYSVAADRRDDVRHGRLHVPHGARRGHPVAQARPAA